MNLHCDIIRRQIALIVIGLAFPLTGMAGVSTLTIDANGNVLNGQAVNFASGQLEVNGVAVSGGGGGGGGNSADASTTVKGISKLSTAPVSSTNPIAVGDNDSRMTNARTPTAHASTHASGGSDPVTPASIGAPSGSGTSTGTNTGDNAVNSLYSGLVSNATHTGDVTGATALTLATAQPAVHTWALAQTFTVAPVFTDQSGSRTALGLGTLATQSGTFSGTSSGTNTGDQIVPANTTATASNWFTAYNSTTGAFTKAQPTFTDLAAHPTTIGGYGITDYNSLGDVRWATIAQGVTTLSLATPGVLYTTPVNFTNTSGAWTGTLSLIAQSANTFFGNGTGSSATPAFMSAATARTALGGTTVGQNLFQLANPSAISFLEIAADNSVSTKTATQMRTDLLPSQTSNSGKYLTTNGTDVSWATVAGGGGTIASTSNILKGDGAGNASSAGFTMPSSYAVGDLVYASGSGALSSLADVATGNVLLSGGVTTAPAYGKVTTAQTTGIAASGANTDLTSLALTAASTLTLAPAANTASAGLTLTDTTAATSGNQQYSPYIYLTGQGWKTTATAGSQSVTFRNGVVPVQGTANPTGSWTLESSVNGGAFANPFSVDTTGTALATAYNFAAATTTGIKSQGGVGIVIAGTPSFQFYAGALRTFANYSYQWSSTTFDDTSSPDAGLNRNAAGVVEVNNGTAGTYRDLKVRAVQSAGVTFANLPTAAAGYQAYITDGLAASCGDTTCTTWGTTVTAGGGALKLLVWYNGTNWTLVGK